MTGVVTRDLDVAIVHEKCIGEIGEPLIGFDVVFDDGLFTPVGGRHHQRGIIEKQVVKRRVGKHDADVAIAGRDARRERAVSVVERAEEHDRPLSAYEELRFVVVYHGERLHHVEIAGHDRERFLHASFASAERLQCFVGARIAGEVEAPDAFTATTPPLASARLADSIAVAVESSSVGTLAGCSENQTRGPHAGHAFGCAWKRRFAGSSYSRSHSEHIGNRLMVVCGRS